MAAALASSGLAGDPARAFAPTAPLSLPPTLDKAPAFEPMFHDASPVVVPPPLAEDAPQPAPSQPEKFVHEPDLEEAAIRFANGDYAGAESGLKEVLVQHQDSDPQQQHDIWMTLFDLYRATGQQVPFDALAIDYAARFGRSAPLWFSLPEQLGLKAMTPDVGAPAIPQRELSWSAQSIKFIPIFLL